MPYILFFILASSCKQNEGKQVPEIKLPRIAIAGLAIESSTFSPAQTHEEAFHARVAEDVFSFYPFLAEDSINRKRAEWIPTLRAHAFRVGLSPGKPMNHLCQKLWLCLRKMALMMVYFLTFTGL